MSDWVLKHSGRIVGGLLVVTALLAAVTGWLIWDDLRQNDQLAGVKNAGPCRAAFRSALEEGLSREKAILQATHDQECREQAFLVEEAQKSLDEEGVVGGGGDNPSGKPAPGDGGSDQAPPERPQEPPREPSSTRPPVDVQIPEVPVGVCVGGIGGVNC